MHFDLVALTAVFVLIFFGLLMNQPTVDVSSCESKTTRVKRVEDKGFCKQRLPPVYNTPEWENQYCFRNLSKLVERCETEQRDLTDYRS